MPFGCATAQGQQKFFQRPQCPARKLALRTVDNSDFLTGEIDSIIKSLTEYKDALKEKNIDKMKELLADGNERKLLSEKMRRSKSSDDK